MVLPDKKSAPQGCNPERPETKTMSQDEINNIKDRLMAQAETRTVSKGDESSKSEDGYPGEWHESH